MVCSGFLFLSARSNIANYSLAAVREVLIHWLDSACLRVNFKPVHGGCMIGHLFIDMDIPVAVQLFCFDYRKTLSLFRFAVREEGQKLFHVTALLY